MSIGKAGNERSGGKLGAKRLKSSEVWSYATGEGINSVAMNGIANFALLFYTQVMGMSPGLAGLALFLATFWDAITDPVMGTITDHTRSRYGRRHPYMLAGGILFSFSFVALWIIPDAFRGQHVLFAYLLIVNLLVKTAFTAFIVPYSALGFEMCRTYADRARLQGVRYGFYMLVNIAFGGFGWVLFFPDGQAADGSRIDGTRIEANYELMGIALGVVTLALVLFCVFATRRYAQSTLVAAGPKTDAGTGIAGTLKPLWHDLKDVYSDRLVWFVFGFFGLAKFSMMVVSQVQMFTYIEYMAFTAAEKTFVHTGGMVAFAAGSLALGGLVTRLDKKRTGYLAMIIASAGGLGLYAVFPGGLLDPRASVGGFPVAVAAFGLLQMMWWGGCGVLVPLAIAMIADLSEMKRWQSGEVTEGRYAAGFSFFLKLANALGLVVTGYLLTSIGYESGASAQAPETVHKLAVTTFLAGPLLMAISFAMLRRYPVTHESMEALRRHYGVPGEDENGSAPVHGEPATVAGPPAG
ncbi:MAG TPA: MFS transporter [Woeseiaceae bacterium]|nr:MFS transporter [Woeseiaceae bacterium]